MSSQEFHQELREFLQKVKWNITGIATADETVIPLPPESRIVTVILQTLALPKIIVWAKTHNITVTDLSENTRGYPDYELSGGDLEKKLVALDIKSARYQKEDTISRMTLGSYHGYFLHPDEKRLLGGKRSYNDYDEHWIATFIYKWNPKKETPQMVEIVERVVAFKWQVASKISGSGDTANIGGIVSLSDLKNLRSEFENREEFEEYWRVYGVNHRRARTRIPEKYLYLVRK
jgi:hypothetical protein